MRSDVYVIHHEPKYKYCAQEWQNLIDHQFSHSIAGLTSSQTSLPLKRTSVFRSEKF